LSVLEGLLDVAGKVEAKSMAIERPRVLRVVTEEDPVKVKG
jgi:hypothetical protein